MRSTRSPSWIDRFLGLDPIPAPPHAFSLDPDGLSFATFRREGSGHWRLEGPVRHEAPGQLVEPGHLGGALRSGETLAHLLRGCLQTASEPVRRASLVVPDSWLRLVFTESPDLPGALRAREEILRFKLRRLVPYRVEDLRLDAVEVTPAPGQAEPRRLLIGFSSDQLLGAVERAFGAEGIHVGRITSRSLALAAALDPLFPPAGLGGVLVADESGFSLTIVSGGEPQLHRRKEGAVPEALLERELRLTRTFLEERFAAGTVDRCFLVAPPAERPTWSQLLRNTLGVEPEALSPTLLPWTGPATAEADAVALYGAVRVEVD